MSGRSAELLDHPLFVENHLSFRLVMNVPMAPLSKTAVVQDRSMAEVMRVESNDCGDSAVFLDTCQVRSTVIDVWSRLMIDVCHSRG
ncbi:protein of unknown function [Candidatus Methylomirabilis oxygeniifera]|uniref:Uncharacterized protein n=1 Tax=Methylomirabilis oxygeniifera TaxID=671143 RepID=D5MGQ7_METO1|nr:protein of unknown function [Candidatus Methylomirabilis oxyfera]